MATGSVSLSGLLGGTAGQIDVQSLIDSLMSAARVPQNQLNDQLSTQQQLYSVYQTINTKMTSLQTAANTLTDPTGWTATAATSSNPGVVASTSDGAYPGSSTFDVVQTAAAQLTTVTTDASGNVLAASGTLTIKGVQITPASGSAADVASAINQAGIGVRASVVQTAAGTSVLQLAGSTTGSAGAFSVSSSDLLGTVTDLRTARDARIEVGDPLAGGYAVESSTNTFTGVVPGVTFTVSAPASDVTITVAQDQKTTSSRVAAVVTAAMTLAAELANDTQQGSPLQGTSALNQLITSLSGTVSSGTAAGTSLFDYGIDLDKNGVISFDADRFAAAYAADPDATQAAVNGFAGKLKDIADSALDPTYGSLTQTMSQITATEDRLNDSISAWNDRLDQTQSNLQAKFLAMQTTLATLQSRQTYLTSMFKSLETNSSDSSS